jgi:hypothetical protein
MTTEITHRKLGGLTKATTVVSWGGGYGGMLRLRDAHYLQRPTNRFMDIASDLPRGSIRKAVQDQEPWWSAASNEPFKWPFMKWLVPIESPSVFLKGGLLKRYLTMKEACQLLNVPGIWSPEAIKQIWNWNDGAPLPVCLQVEVLLQSSEWFGDGNGPVGFESSSDDATMNEFS